MPNSRRRVPKYRHYKPKDLAVVRIDGQDQYLGKYNSPESREKYHRLIAEWLGNGQRSQSDTDQSSADPPSLSVNELILGYWRFAKSYYVKDGRPTKELAGLREALLPLRQLYGHTPASRIGPKKLKAVRQHMIDNGLSRRVVNKRVSRIKRLFKWAVAEELVPPSLHHGLQAVTGLRFGRTQARETEPIRPVPDLYVAAVLPFLTPHVAAMIKTQRMTGVRSSELVIMRPCDIDTSGDVWIYEPFDHKTRWRGHRKLIALGPEAQRILTPFLDRDPKAFLFSPREAERWRLDNRPPYHGRQRKTPVYPSELKRREKVKLARRRRKSKRPKRERYDTDSYRRAIEYGLKKAAKAGVVVPHWHPHQLRHNRGTEVRRKHGIEAAQVSLGHARADVTEVYAEKNMELAKRIAREMG
jgi:site-specific recombinase XerC